MAKALPMRKLLKLVDEVQQTMKQHPDSDVEFLIRGNYESDSEGEVSVRADVGAPATVVGVDAQAGGGFSRHWTSLGDGEFVLRVYRPGSVTAGVMLEAARRGGDMVDARVALDPGAHGETT